MEPAEAEHAHPERGLVVGKTADAGQIRALRGPGPGLPSFPALCEPIGGSGEDHHDKVTSLLFNMLSWLVIAFLPRSKHLLISWLQ